MIRFPGSRIVEERLSAYASKDEVRYTTIAKALGIIAVVIGHSGSPLRPYLYLYHLALFYFVSGYFYRDEYANSPLLLIKKRIKTLYVPYVAYQLVFLSLHNVFMQFQIYTHSIQSRLYLARLPDKWSQSPSVRGS